MYKLMFVEDEKIIRLGLEKLLNWNDLNIKLCTSANNGETAKSTIERENPDIIITDIRMPEKNGIELLQWTKQNYPDIIIILLSGYDDFEYAQKGLNFGAYAYVTKLNLEKELKPVILRALSEINEAQFNKLSIHDFLTQDISNLNSIFDVHLSSSNSIIGFLFIIRVVPYNEKYVRSIYKYLKTIILPNIELYCKIEKQKIYAIVHSIHKKISDIQECERFILNYLNKFNIYAQDVIINTIISDYIKNTAQIKNVFEEFDRFFEHYLTKQRVIKHTDIINLEKDSRIKYISEKETSNLINLFITSKPEDFYQGIERIKNAIKSYTVIDIIELKTELIIPCQHIREIVFAQSSSTVDNDLIKLINKLDDVIDIDDIFNYLTEYLESLFEFYSNKIGELDPVNRAISYMQRNYNKPLDLLTIAKYINISPSYLSRLLSEKYGTSFTEYLNILRIDKAKDLIVNTDMKIKNIAKIIGYENNYFCRIFKKTTGLSPTQYRNNNMKK